MKWLLRLLGCRCNEKDKEIEELEIEINNLKVVIEEIKKQQNIVEPKRLGEISITELYAKLAKELKCAVYMSDTIYGLTSVEEAMKFSNETKVQYNIWKEEKFDCDEFSFALMGYWNKGLEQFAFGIAWSGSHAFNIMIDSNKEIWIIEPQSNAFFKLEDVKTNSLYYPMRMVII